MIRPSNRASDEVRNVVIHRHYTRYAEGSVLIEMGHTKVLCNATIEEGVPRFIRGKQRGWLTAEYGMLPRATLHRTTRESMRGKPQARSQEIQRLIGRSLRAAIDLEKLGERTVTIDCDVIQADGGTRTAAITGSFVALWDAIGTLLNADVLDENPITHQIASVSVGIYAGECIVDLDYLEDSDAETDMNVVMAKGEKFIEIQGTAEQTPFTQPQLTQLLTLAKIGIGQLYSHQSKALDN